MLFNRFGESDDGCILFGPQASLTLDTIAGAGTTSSAAAAAVGSSDNNANKNTNAKRKITVMRN